MDKIIGNYLLQPNKDFPLDCEALDYMAQNQAILEALGNMAGDKVILTGCALRSGGTARDAGLVFLRTRDYPAGEVLRWEGGSVTAGMHLYTEDIPVTADGLHYPKAYTIRRLREGLGAENYDWKDFAELSTTRALGARVAELEAQLKNVKGDPLGTIVMWAGISVPEGWRLCNGEALPIEEYKDLHKVLGSAYNQGANANGTLYSTPSGHFRLPDLQGRFVVGQSTSAPLDAEYTTLGKAGGEKTHTLTVEEMPAHSHKYATGTDSYLTSRQTNGHRAPMGWDTEHETQPTGKNLAHENRPPYYVLAYIIKCKN